MFPFNEDVNVALGKEFLNEENADAFNVEFYEQINRQFDAVDFVDNWGGNVKVEVWGELIPVTFSVEREDDPDGVYNFSDIIVSLDLVAA
jgi:hypothetical protein